MTGIRFPLLYMWTWLLIGASHSAFATTNVCLVTTTINPITLKLKDDLIAAENNIAVRYVTLGQPGDFGIKNCPDINILVGQQTLSFYGNRKVSTPAIATFVSQDEFIYEKRLHNTRLLTAIYHDPPLVRQAFLGGIILPNAKNFAILTSKKDTVEFETLVTTMERYGLQGRVFSVTNSSQFHSVLRQAVSQYDFLLGTLDREIYHSANIKHLLLTTYRHNRFLIGPTLPYVKAGALASTHTSTEQLAHQLVDWILQYKSTNALPAPAYANDFTVSVNRQVARSLNIPIPPSDELKNLIAKKLAEGQP